MVVTVLMIMNDSEICLALFRLEVLIQWNRLIKIKSMYYMLNNEFSQIIWNTRFKPNPFEVIIRFPHTILDLCRTS